jgi:hypothetical protein
MDGMRCGQQMDLCDEVTPLERAGAAAGSVD